MSYNNKSIVPGILIKTKKGIGGNPINYGDYGNSKDRFYILTEIEIEDEHEHDILVFYGLTEEQFFRRYRLFIEKYTKDGSVDIVA